MLYVDEMQSLPKPKLTISTSQKGKFQKLSLFDRGTTLLVVSLGALVASKEFISIRDAAEMKIKVLRRVGSISTIASVLQYFPEAKSGDA
ncbi:hypothetical protein BOTCAL_0134g00040 [Botryotinia calthae]|uniref:Uncharacterized protein n=1 Tax=Botryotinia calthae TaxID=38488 RepID=A0A4Y8D3J9_9HELO|nr:hypothetical protein BOTCAL_0134g00040 [Botryotinia calthae]